MPEEQAAQQTTTQNCAGCNKPLKKLRIYYRNGKYFCGKRCFKDKFKKAQEENTGE